MKRQAQSLLFLVFAAYTISPGSTLAAKDYQSEVLFETGHFEDSHDLEANTYRISVRQYFAPVEINNHPYAETTFLERGGSFYLALTPGDFYAPSFSGDSMRFSAVLTYMRNASPLFAATAYSKHQLEYDPPVNFETDEDEHALALGVFIRERLLVWAQYSDSEAETSRQAFRISYLKTTPIPFISSTPNTRMKKTMTKMMKAKLQVSRQRFS